MKNKASERELMTMIATLRMKKRYVAFKCIGPESEAVIEREIKDAVYTRATEFFGELGYSELGFKFIGYDAKAKVGAVRCARGKEKLVVAMLALLSSIAGKKARTMPVSTSGTINTIKEKYTDLED